MAFENLIKIIENDMHVDELATGGNNFEKVKEIKKIQYNYSKKGSFNLHKWNSNVPELESDNSNQSELTCTKQVLNQGNNEIKSTRPGLEQAKWYIISSHTYV